jgi:peptidoglycan/xylan/chitin deacetylase (PgdA/CDA1 family)
VRTRPGSGDRAPARVRVRWGVVAVYVLVLVLLPTAVLAGTRHQETPPAPVVTASAALPSARTVRPAERQARTCGKPSRVVMHRAPAAASRTVALTFDDGPGRQTGAVLDVLRREHVHATFFLVGNQLARHRGLARRVVSEGHTVANHSETHPLVAPRPGWKAAVLERELQRSQHHFAATLGIRPCYFRPPGGVVRGAPAVAREHGLTIVLWSVDPRDWADGRARSIERKAEAGLRQQHPIVLLHDGGSGGPGTVAALPKVIERYRAHGYTFVTVDGRT